MDLKSCLYEMRFLPSSHSLLLVMFGTLLGFCLARGAPIVFERVMKRYIRGEDASTYSAPKHIAVIMDGNRRFGKEKTGDPLKGHWAGGQTLLDFVQWCMNDGVQIVSVYAFSTENWSRDASEINLLMTLFGKYAETMTVEAKRRNVKVRILSTDYHRLPQRVIRSMEKLEEVTKDCNGLLLNVCLSYGARAEITAACSSLVEDILLGTLKVNGVDVNPEESRSSLNGGLCGSNCSDKRNEGGIEESKGEPRETKPKSDESIGASHGARSEHAKDVNKEEGRMYVTVKKQNVAVTEEMVKNRLLTKQLPDPDVLIRTSGEVRISNFLLFQLAYTEMFFVDKFWPEFVEEDFKRILKEFAQRKRRFGT